MQKPLATTLPGVLKEVSSVPEDNAINMQFLIGGHMYSPGVNIQWKFKMNNEPF